LHQILRQNDAMALSQITRTNVLAAIDEFDRIGRDQFLATYGYGEAVRYILVHEDREYDSKAIAGVAHRFVDTKSEALANTDFSGGDKRVGDFLRKLGFEVLDKTPKVRNPSWSRDELVLALEHYLKNPGVSHDPGKPEIVELSREINAIASFLGASQSETLRNPNGVSMKLLNFRAHDPEYIAKGQTGLTRGNRLESELWHEFASDLDRLSQVSATIRTAIHEQSGEDQGTAVDPETSDAVEGKIVTRIHRARERDQGIVKRKKTSCRRKHGRLFCEACAFDFHETYGERGDGFIECHHLNPLALSNGDSRTRLDDLALLCANCHRMVHAKTPWLSLDELKALVNKSS